MASISNEDFVKNIFLMKSTGQKASATLLALRLGVSAAAITDMSRKLSRDGLIVYEKYRELNLTPQGQKIALSVIRRHRLWELFLNRVLDIPWDKVHDEAEKLEHQTSDFLINRIDEYLEFPELDPHGDPIPDQNGIIKEYSYLRLSEINPSTAVIIKRIINHTGDLMVFLNDHNLNLNQHLEVLEKNTDGSLSLKVDIEELKVSEAIATNIFVEIV